MNKKVSEQFKDIKDIYLLQCICTEQDEEIERLHSIIKEVREYIGSKEHYEDTFDTEIEKINKIIDKENKQ